MRRRHCGGNAYGAARGDITYKPMRGVTLTLVRRGRFRRTVPQHAAAAPRRRIRPRIVGKHTQFYARGHIRRPRRIRRFFLQDAEH